MSLLLVGVGGSVVAGGQATANPTNAWAGNVSPTTATVSHRLDADAAARLVVSTASDLSSPVYSGSVASAVQSVRHKITGLSPNTAYHYGIEVGGVLRTALKGQFRTLRAAGAQSFRFGTIGCSSTPTSDVAAWLLASAALDFAVHLGDIHYQDINSTDATLYDAALDTALTADQGALLRNVATFYTWDDHDFCGDNSNSTATGKNTQLVVARRRFPTDNADRWLTGATDPIGFSFVSGRVRFIVPDGRSAKVASGTNWGSAQQSAVFAEITAAKAAGQVVVLVNSYPASATEFPAAQRTALWDHIKTEGMQSSVLMISGDAHMIGFDDGTNHNFATGGGAPIPQFVANGLNRTNSTKGGPWSGGTFTGSVNQAGVVDVTDTGGATIAFSCKGYRDAGVLVATFSVSLGVPGAAGDSTPDAFAFTDQNSAATSTVYTSNSVTIAGIDTSAAVTVSGGEYRKNGGSWTSSAGTAVVGDTFEVRGTSSASASTAVNVTLTVGGVSDTYTITTAAAGATVPTIIQQASNSATSGTTVTGTLPAPATAGNLIIAGVFADKSPGAFTAPAGFTLLGSAINGTGVGGAIYWKIAAGGETAVTGTWTASKLSAIVLLEIDGAAASAPIRDSAVGNGGSATALTRSASASNTVSANELALAIFTNDSADSITGGETWTGVDAVYSPTITPTNAPAIKVGARLLASGSAVSATYAYTGTADESILWVLSIKPEGA